jgi:hypothetical protein
MAWRRAGSVQAPVSNHPTLASHAALPVAALLGGDLIRIFYSGRDQANRSAIGSLVLRLGEIPRVEDRGGDPVLTPGTLGAFDDAGLGVGSVVPDPAGDRLYYMGWNVGGSVPWRNAIGLAIGSLATGRFERFAVGPVMDRDPVDHFSLSYPWVVRMGARDWRIWYGTHITWGAEKADMSHVIRAARSDDGILWQRSPKIALGPEGDEIAVVRPSVRVGPHVSEMWFARRDHGNYRLGYAISTDLVTWSRQPGQVLDPEGKGWEGDAITYPSVFDALGRRWLLYNGCCYGATGFGLAVWDE